MTKAKEFFKWLCREVDLRDRFVFSGIGLSAYGAWQIYPPAGWIVLGVSIFWLGVRNSGRVG